jgi:ubiquinone/menaquinone biosynthesis C-methylase UbiE
VTLENRRFNHKKMHALMDSERQARWDPSRFLSRFAIHPGESILELGSGPGFWTFHLAELVGDKGTVWAIDVSQEMLDAIAKQNPPKQVHLLQAELPKINFPESSFDRIWAAFVFHEVTQPEILSAEMYRLIRKDGAVAILDWRPDAIGDSGPPRHHRVSVAEVARLLHKAGFGSVERTWQDDDAYLIEAKWQ